MGMKLKEHDITLHGDQVTLRPMTENDWDVLLKWNSDPAVLYYSEGSDVKSYNLEQVQGMYRYVSQAAFLLSKLPAYSRTTETTVASSNVNLRRRRNSTACFGPCGPLNCVARNSLVTGVLHNQPLKLTGAAILVFRGSMSSHATPAA
jgi:hypothetical protein